MTTITDPEALPSADSTAAPGELTTVPHWKAGTTFAGTSERTSDVYDPATGRVTKRLALASRADAEVVIAAAAAAAWPGWREVSLARRTQILFRFRELLNERKHEAAGDHHQRGRQCALRRSRRGDPW